MRDGREGRSVTSWDPACDKCLVTVVSAHPTGCPADQRATAVPSMTPDGRRVIGGVDAHTDTHDAAVLDDRGELLATKSFAVSAAGYRELLAWLRRFGELERIGVESTGSYAAGLTRHLVAEGMRVLEVNQPHAHERRRRGKTDAIDAEMAARHALSLFH